MSGTPKPGKYSINIPPTHPIPIFSVGPLDVNIFGGGTLIIPQTGPPSVDPQSGGVSVTFHFDFGTTQTTQSTTIPPPSTFNTTVQPPDPTPTPTDTPPPTEDTPPPTEDTPPPTEDTPPPTEDTPPPTEDTPPPTEDTPEPTPTFDSFDSAPPFDSFDSAPPFDSFDSAPPFDSFDDSDLEVDAQKTLIAAADAVAGPPTSDGTYNIIVPAQQIPGAPAGVYYAGTFTAQVQPNGQITISAWAVTLNCAWPGGGTALLPVPPQPS